MSKRGVMEWVEEISGEIPSLETAKTHSRALFVKKAGNKVKIKQNIHLKKEPIP
jgi:hypothetical protein